MDVYKPAVLFTPSNCKSKLRQLQSGIMLEVTSKKDYTGYMSLTEPNADWLERLPIVGGHLALDFVNSTNRRATSIYRDCLETPDYFIFWCRYLGLVNNRQSLRLRALSPQRKGRLLCEAYNLRELLNKIFHAYLERKPVASGLAHLNEILKGLNDWRSLDKTATGFEWQCHFDETYPKSLLAPLAFAGAELLDSPELRQLKACPPPDGCNWLFLDRSRNGSRVWCSMEMCGNRTKLRRYRARQAQPGPGGTGRR